MLRLLFCLRRKRSHPPAPLLLLFRKRARSARLLGCKRPHNGSLSLPPFCGCLRPKLTASAKNPATVCRGGIFPQGALPPMWREFSPPCSKNSLFSPTGEGRQMPFGLPTGSGSPFVLQPGRFVAQDFRPRPKRHPQGCLLGLVLPASYGSRPLRRGYPLLAVARRAVGNLRLSRTKSRPSGGWPRNARCGSQPPHTPPSLLAGPLHLPIETGYPYGTGIFSALL